MKDIAIYGFGGCGRELACLINRNNRTNPTWNLIGFFDDGKKVGERNDYGCVLGGMKELNSWNQPLCIAFAICSPKILSRLTNSITNILLEFPNIISSDTVFMDENNLRMGKGNLVFSGSLISCNVQIGDFNIFNSMNIIGHDSTIGNYNICMPATKLSGMVMVGNENLFGVSSVVLQQIQIGNNTIVGANSLIINKTKDYMTYMGCPATIVHY